MALRRYVKADLSVLSSDAQGADASSEGRCHQVKKRILVVDDTPFIRDLLRLILEGSGYEVSEAQHGGDAIRQMHDPLPDLVMTDLMMPIMNGQQLVQSLRSDRRTALVPILVLSSNPNAAEIATMADAVVGKPFNREVLLATVSSLVSQGDGR
jgi:two-component system, chemotaxis family, chemotaxis protein CheY